MVLSQALWALNAGIHIKQFELPRPKQVPRNNSSSIISAFDMGISDEEWNRLQKAIDWPIPDQEITHLNPSTSPVHSTFSIVGLKESYEVGENISVTITARDHNTNLKRYGGDFFKAKLFNTELKVCYIIIYYFLNTFFAIENKYNVSFALIVDLLAKYCILYLSLKALQMYLPTDISSLSVGHSRRHIGGPTNWDLA